VKRPWRKMGAVSNILACKRIAVDILASRVLLYINQSISQWLYLKPRVPSRRDREDVRRSALIWIEVTGIRLLSFSKRVIVALREEERRKVCEPC
jgi:hypothetical protein